MKLKTIQINWHGNPSESIFSIDFQIKKEQEFWEYKGNKEPMLRFATAGGDHKVRMWRLTNLANTPDVATQRDQALKFGGDGSSSEEVLKVQYLCTLDRHPSPVNVVRFSPDGTTLASAGDNGSIVLWKQKIVKNEIDPETGFPRLTATQDEFALEWWHPTLIFRGSLSDIYDLSWSECGKFIITGSVDNTARIWDVSNGLCLLTLTDHHHYVQGVAWDPLGEFFTSQSSDRSIKIYHYPTSKRIEQAKLVASHSRLTVPNKNAKPIKVDGDEQSVAQVASTKSINLYQSEALISFFRRPCFSPDGSLLITPAGIGSKGSSDYCVHIYPRFSLLSSPPIRLTGFKSPVIAVRCSPKLYPIVPNTPSQFDLPYRVIIACATQDAVVIYDTQHTQPLCQVAKIHYRTLTDLSWSNDGTQLFVTSADGYCTLIQFEAGELVAPEAPPAISLADARARLMGANTRIQGLEKINMGTGTGETKKKVIKSKAEIIVKVASDDSSSDTPTSNAPKKRRIVPTLVVQDD